MSDYRQCDLEAHLTKTAPAEFCAVWFDNPEGWRVLLSDGTALPGIFGAIGYAANAAYDHFKLGESDFEVVEDTGTFYRYIRDEPLD